MAEELLRVKLAELLSEQFPDFGQANPRIQATVNGIIALFAHPVPEQDGWRDMSVEPDGPCGVLFHYPRERHADLVPGHDYSVRCGAWTGKYFVEQGTGHDVFEHEDREDWPTAWRPLPLPEQEAV